MSSSKQIFIQWKNYSVFLAFENFQRLLKEFYTEGFKTDAR